MKKIFTLITAIMLLSGVAKSQINFWINIDSTDAYYAIDNGLSYSRFAWNTNMNYTVADTPGAGLNYIIVAFDTLVDPYNPIPVAYSPTQYPMVKVDSIMAWVGQVNYSGIDDTLIFKIMSVDGNGYPSSTIYWVDTTIIPHGNPLNGTFFGLAPNLQLSTNRFCVKLEYYGSLLDTFMVVAGCPSFAGAVNCTGFTMADTSWYRHNTISDYVWTNYHTGGLYPTEAGVDVFYNCDLDTVFDYGIDGSSFLQDADIWAKVELTGSIICNGLTIATNPTPAQCSNCADGWVSATYSGGTPPYHFSWNTIPVQTTQDATGLLPGTYTVTITDSNNCIATSTAIVNNASICSANFLLYPDSIPHTWYIINQSFGVQPIHYNWNWGDSTAHDTTEFPSHTYADTGYYTICLSILDAVGCSTSYCNSYYLNRMENAMVNVFVIGSTTGIKEVSNPTSVEIIPNPNNGNFVLSYHLPNSQLSTLNSQFIIKDVLGRTVYNKTIPDTDGTMTINVSELGSGIYYWEVITNSRIAVNGKIAVEK